MKPEKYYIKIKQKPTMNQIIKKGITTETINNTKNTNQQQINQIKRKLLEPLIKDQQLLEILSEDQNFNKLKNRLDYKLTIQGETITGQAELAKAEKHGTTINEAIQEINQTIIIGERTKKDETTPLIQRLKDLGWYNTETLLEGYITNPKLTITLRKGK